MLLEPAVKSIANKTEKTASPRQRHGIQMLKYETQSTAQKPNLRWHLDYSVASGRTLAVACSWHVAANARCMQDWEQRASERRFDTTTPAPDIILVIYATYLGALRPISVASATPGLVR